MSDLFTSLLIFTIIKTRLDVIWLRVRFDFDQI
jgi:hypothetical protein